MKITIRTEDSSYGVDLAGFEGSEYRLTGATCLGDNVYISVKRKVEELPESQEEEYCFCGGKSAHTHLEFQPQEKEECEHENWSETLRGGFCHDCQEAFSRASRRKPSKEEECKGGNHKFLDGEGICICGSVARQKPQPKQKPSVWIARRAEHYLKDIPRNEIDNNTLASCCAHATCDFLDSHADIFNK